MADSYRCSDDPIRRQKSAYRSLNDSPAVREYNESERLRKEAARLRKAASTALSKAA